MSEPPAVDLRDQLDAVYRAEAGRIRATLIRLLGSFDLAEDAMHDAFSAALQRWPIEGRPANPRAWLISTARFKAIDTIRRRTRFDTAQADIADTLHGGEPAAAAGDDDELPDDRLKLIFTCCHPALAPDARAALTLREVCGLTTEEIARAFLTSAPTIAQRIVRAKAKIREERLPYQVPSGAELRSGSARCSPWFICCSTKATPRRRALRSLARTCRRKPSGSAASCSSCCRSRR
jgi:RNA polymerase sigma-70 factor, ECF subfamily